MRNGWMNVRYVAAVAGLVATLQAGSSAHASMEITEWMYQGANGEFIEFTNTGPTAINMAGWSYSDTDRELGDVDLSAFGVVQSGESVILTETAAATFRTAWGLSAGVKIIGSNTDSQLGRADEIHLYNPTVEVDSLVYDDQTGKGLRTQNKSCNIPVSGYALTTASSSWPLASVGDAYGSWKSTGNDIGSPGRAPLPEPATLAFLALGSLIRLRPRRRST